MKIKEAEDEVMKAGWKNVPETDLQEQEEGREEVANLNLK